jgi:Asp-tRNA(Asn)/Glu-tRNA(Gln) amidotransferase A subunit family amidase
MDEIVYWSAKRLAEAIHTKELSSLEVIDAHLRRIAEVNPKLNAIVQLTTETARVQARQADAPWPVARSGGRYMVCHLRSKTLCALPM